jgi:KaiC/GvpD/RAD55 family RecA-like ATPase/5S rRNA maturation endonuclease (ribonuclease M5)
VSVIEKVETLDTAIVSTFKPLDSYPERFLELRLPQGVLFTTADGNNLAIVGRDWGNKIVSIKYRSIRGDKLYFSEPGSEVGKFFLPYDKEVHAKERQVLLVEGEIDAITARVLGFPGDIIALQTTSIKEDTVKYVRRRYAQIFFGLDNDEAGHKATKELENQFRFKDYTVLQYPTECKDLNEILTKNGVSYAERWMRREVNGDSRNRIVQGSSLFEEFYRSVDNIQSVPTIRSGFGYLDEKLGGGLREGELTIVHAKAKTGKTTFLNQIVSKQLQEGTKVGLASFEMNAVNEILPSIFSIITGENFRSSKLARDLVKATEGDLIDSVFEPIKYLSVYNQHLGNASLDSIIQFIEEIAHTGTKLVCIDHALFLVKSAKESDEHVEVCRQLALAAGKYKIHIILVAQAPKLADEAKLGIDTVYGGVAAAMFAHNFITLQRDKTNTDILEVRLVACRYPNSRPSYEPVILGYDRETCRLID